LALSPSQAHQIALCEIDLHQTEWRRRVHYGLRPGEQLSMMVDALERIAETISVRCS
jgi:hypothetical protein